MQRIIHFLSISATSAHFSRLSALPSRQTRRKEIGQSTSPAPYLLNNGTNTWFHVRRRAHSSEKPNEILMCSKRSDFCSFFPLSPLGINFTPQKKTVRRVIDPSQRVEASSREACCAWWKATPDLLSSQLLLITKKTAAAVLDEKRDPERQITLRFSSFSFSSRAAFWQHQRRARTLTDVRAVKNGSESLASSIHLRGDNCSA